MTLPDLLAGKRVCVCAGSGGVGKTTTAAAIGLGMAARDMRVAVLTIDPARRLADVLAASGPEGDGDPSSMTLDPQRTLDELIGRLARDERARERILSNPVYRELSRATAGLQELAAVAKLYELDREGEFDLIVLDTPPSRNALQFLDAPALLERFFAGRGLRALASSTDPGLRIAGRSSEWALRALGRATGVDLLTNLSALFGALGGALDGFSERAAHVRALLRGAEATFLLITSPAREPIEEALFMRRRFQASGAPLGGVIVNRFRGGPIAEHDAAGLAAGLATRLEPGLARRVELACAEHSSLARRDHANLAGLLSRLDGEHVVVVPELDDPSEASGLAQMERHLFDYRANDASPSARSATVARSTSR